MDHNGPGENACLFEMPELRVLGMPPLFPVAVAMAFELATYGLLSGILYRVFPKTIATSDLGAEQDGKVTRSCTFSYSNFEMVTT